MAKKDPIKSKAALDIAWPTWLDLLVARGITEEEALSQLEKLFNNFPQGVPREIVFDWVRNTFDSGVIMAKLAEVVTAAEKAYRTGKGPTAHSSSELA